MCATGTGEEGLTYVEANCDPEKQKWLQARAEGLQSFQDNQVWEVVSTPINASTVQYSSRQFLCPDVLR
ncbi:hypothetical protein EVAR_64297_1 [Eumeta japonica]|uniref:Uncharacterized protein n=1 Tax=Eumeta variegata TaxID=151549 RepID=A0A4C1ZQH6_EUMVA|nr:hypothetical protein EVAR_64297_1 [Eumeta japonica]